MGTVAREPPYRITLSDHSWQVMRPHGSMPHAFDELDDALEFVRKDSDGLAEIVELLVGSVYMVKRIGHTG
jgi:hypothetical protein